MFCVSYKSEGAVVPCNVCLILQILLKREEHHV